METILIIIAVLFLLIGIIGCFLPILPGPPIALISLFLIKLTSISNEITWAWICVFVALTIIVTVLDYIVPAYGTKKFGGTSYGIWGAALGMIAGLFFLPFGIIAGPFLGALIGEIIRGTSYKQSIKSAFGTFVGFMLGIGLKFILCIWMAGYFIFTVFI